MGGEDGEKEAGAKALEAGKPVGKEVSDGGRTSSVLGEKSRARCTGCVGCGGCLGQGYKQEKMYFAATRKSRREVRVGGHCGAVAIA